MSVHLVMSVCAHWLDVTAGPFLRPIARKTLPSRRPTDSPPAALIGGSHEPGSRVVGWLADLDRSKSLDSRGAPWSRVIDECLHQGTAWITVAVRDIMQIRVHRGPAGRCVGR